MLSNNTPVVRFAYGIFGAVDFFVTARPPRLITNDREAQRLCALGLIIGGGRTIEREARWHHNTDCLFKEPSMIPHRLAFIFAMLLVPLAPPILRAAEQRPPFELVEGDRVVLVGNAFIERDQKYGYLETLLTSRYPDRNIIFRNVGWSGDTVFSQVRSGSGPQKGVEALVSLILEQKPTVVIIGYGMNESFEGDAGLPRFIQGYNAFLDALAPSKARFVLLSPIRHEDLGRPLPDPAEHNRLLALYSAAIGRTASERGLHFVNLFADLASDRAEKAALTENGIHLNAFGYSRAAATIGRSLGVLPERWRLRIDAAGKEPRTSGANISDYRLDKGVLEFKLLDKTLPGALVPPGVPSIETVRMIQVSGLATGKYELRIDNNPIESAAAEEWARGVLIVRGPEYDQVEKLRETIGAKNTLFFDQYRPQNDMYIFFGRKNEQGRNAVEIPRFDKFIAEKESEIAKLHVPVSHTYRLEKVQK
jgi:hypothetical protein